MPSYADITKKLAQDMVQKVQANVQTLKQEAEEVKQFRSDLESASKLMLANVRQQITEQITNNPAFKELQQGTQQITGFVDQLKESSGLSKITNEYVEAREKLDNQFQAFVDTIKQFGRDQMSQAWQGFQDFMQDQQDNYQPSADASDTSSADQQTAPSQSHYATLGITQDASSKEIDEAYFNKAHENHPDRGGSEEAEKSINKAYNELSDPEKRNDYDNTLAQQQQEQAATPSPSTGPSASSAPKPMPPTGGTNPGGG